MTHILKEVPKRKAMELRSTPKLVSCTWKRDDDEQLAIGDLSYIKKYAHSSAAVPNRDGRFSNCLFGLPICLYKDVFFWGFVWAVCHAWLTPCMAFFSRGSYLRGFFSWSGRFQFKLFRVTCASTWLLTSYIAAWPLMSMLHAWPLMSTLTLFSFPLL